MPELESDTFISCGLASGIKIHDYCLEPGKIEALKMLDLETKSAINLDNLQVQH